MISLPTYNIHSHIQQVCIGGAKQAIKFQKNSSIHDLNYLTNISKVAFLTLLVRFAVVAVVFGIRLFCKIE